MFTILLSVVLSVLAVRVSDRFWARDLIKVKKLEAGEVSRNYRMLDSGY